MAKFTKFHSQDDCRGRDALEPIIVTFLILIKSFLIFLVVLLNRHNFLPNVQV